MSTSESENKQQKSDVTRAFKEDGTTKTHIGGQALLEGIMMRGKHNWALAVREPSGAIHIEEHKLSSGKDKNKWMYWPLIRGCRALVESLMLGYKALQVAASHAFEEEDEQIKDDELTKEEEQAEEAPKTVQTHSPQTASAEKETEKEEFFGKKEMALSLVLGMALGIFLFVVAPALIANLIVGEYDSNTLLWNIVDGLVRVMVFIFYVWLIGRMSDIKRMFGYHGAEHKAIHCYEHGMPLTPENARSFPCLHVRCGTAFMIMVMILAILVYTITPINGLIDIWGVPDGPLKLLLVIVVRILLLPVIAGLSYEITVKWAGSRPNNPLVRIILWPGMQMQRLTTNEPDDGQIECAIVAMQQVLDYEAKLAEEAKLVEEGAKETVMVKQGAC